ncbi:MAG: response regulator [Flavobacteriales bacterium]
MIDILLVDDHKIIRDGIRALLQSSEDIRIVAECSDGSEVNETLRAHNVDIVLMDINMPKMSGLEATEEVLKEFPDMKVVALTMYNEESYISRILNQGAVGYILKNTGKQELVEALRKIRDGGNYFSEEVTQQIMSRFMSPSKSDDPSPGGGSLDRLTNREKEVLRLIAMEYTNHEIGDHLNVSTRTIDSHRRNLLQKLGVKNTAGLVRFALQNDLTKER